MTTFWNGHRSEDNNTITQYINETEDRTGAIEDFLKFAQTYYDIHNNGCFNWNRHGPGYRAVSRKYNVDPYCASSLRVNVRYGHKMERLEELGNLVMDAALKHIAEKSA